MAVTIMVSTVLAGKRFGHAEHSMENETCGLERGT